MKPIHIFYHIGMVSQNLGDQSWAPLVIRQLERLKSSGLYNACTTLNIGYATDDRNPLLSHVSDERTLSHILEKFNLIEKTYVVEAEALLKDYEYHTNRAIYNFAINQNQESHIFYFHNKGSTRGEQQCILDWVELLEYFNIDHWREAVSRLENGYDLYGANYKSQCENPPHFSGNFWWANISYIKTLNVNRLSLSDRLSAEMWPCSNIDHKVYCTYNSLIDHYGECYPENIYKTKDKITVSPKISTIISYSTNDKQFLRDCISHVKDFSEEIIISFCDKFFDGVSCKQEDIDDSIDIINELGAKAVMFKYNENINPQKGEEYESRWWNNYQRFQAWKNLTLDCDWILWLDADEIVDTEKFVKWIKFNDINQYDSYSLANYWYWKETDTVADKIESNTIFTKRVGVKESDFFKNPKIERENFLYGRQQHCKYGLNGDVLIHHFSWVRNEEQMLRKVKSWSHNKDNVLLNRIRKNTGFKDWPDIVSAEFSGKLSSDKDFVHSYNLRKINPYIVI